MYFDLLNYLGSRAGFGKIISARSNTNFLPTFVGKGLSYISILLVQKFICTGECFVPANKFAIGYFKRNQVK